MPFFFVAYDHVNYSRYLPVYWSEMKRLPQTHPPIHAAFQEGQFTVNRQDNHGFAEVAEDQTIEQTINRDTKKKGGVTTTYGYYHITFEQQ